MNVNMDLLKLFTNFIWLVLDTFYIQTILLSRLKADKTYQQIYLGEATITILNTTNVPDVHHIHSSVEYIFGRRWHPSSQLTALAQTFCIATASRISFFLADTLHKTKPYMREVSESLKRIFRRNKVALAMKPHKTLKQLLVHPKDNRSPQEQSGMVGVVYSIPCKDCHCVYVR